MPTATEKKYNEMSLEELDLRGAELRGGLGELAAGERSDKSNTQIRNLLGEVEILDKAFTLARMHSFYEADVRAAAEAAERANELGPLGANGLHSGTRGTPPIGDQIMAAREMLEWIEHGMRGGKDEVGVSFSLDGLLRDGIRAVSEWSTSTGPGNAATGTINALLPVGQPIAPVPRQARLSMRDLIPSQNTTLSTIPYVRELAPTSNELGASAVPETGTKPDVTLSFAGFNANPTVIAASVSPSKQLWEDAPLVVAYINQRLPYLVKFKEDAEIIGGSGTWPDIQGIKNVTGVQTATPVSGQYAQSIGNAIATIENVDGTATGAVLNPTDAWKMFTLRAAAGAGTFDAGIPFSMQALDSLTVWGLPTVRSRVYTQGSALVGDFAHGAMILDRDGVNVQIYPQHSTYALSNQILVLCEERCGLAVWRPDLFATVTLS